MSRESGIAGGRSDPADVNASCSLIPSFASRRHSAGRAHSESSSTKDSQIPRPYSGGGGGTEDNDFRAARAMMPQDGMCGARMTTACAVPRDQPGSDAGVSRVIMGISEKKASDPRAATAAESHGRLAPAIRLRSGRVHGGADALYERHLLFDNVVDPAAAGAARALRGPRPLRARRPLAALGADRADLRAREPQARLLPLDGVPDRPLAGQQHHEPAARARWSSDAVKQTGPRLARACSSRSPTPAWATAASGGWPPASSTRWPRCSSRPWATGCATSTASSGRRSSDGWQLEQPDNWLRRPDPWEVARPDENGRGQAELLVRAARRERCAPIAGRPSTPDRHPLRPAVVGYGGKTINTLRLWAAAAPDYFDFQAVQPAATSSARWPRRSRPSR